MARNFLRQHPGTELPTHTDAIAEIVLQGVAVERPLAEIPPHVRAGWLRQVASTARRDSEPLAALIVREGIKTIREARGEVARAARTLEICAEEATRIGGESLDFGGSQAGDHRTGWTVRRPVGLVAAITPFNDPLNLVAHKVGPAIAAGCPLILKPHAKTPGPAKRLRDLFLEAGMPEGAFQVLGDTTADAGRALVENPSVRMLSFTGGRAVGTAVAASAAGRPVSLELGGICSTIVLEDADIEPASDRIASGMFAAAGQNCLHVQRVFIAEQVFEPMMQRLLNRANSVRLGDPMDEDTDMGELVDELAIRRCEDFVADAVSRGGRIATGGARERAAFLPTILTDTPPEALIHTEEVFGPITAVDRIGGIDDAVARLETADASLATAIFTRSLNPPLALRRLRTGSIVVNDSTDFRTDDMPFGGPFPAGLSREGVRYAMNSMLETQLICINLN